jgi:hypothetical protein
VLLYVLALRFHAGNATTGAIAQIPIIVIFAIGGFAASVYATMLGGLADDNDGHLSLAWTKPASRARYAL